MINNNFSLIYGILLGDGCLSKIGNHYSIVISCDFYSDKKLFDYIIPIIEELRGKKIKYYSSKKQGKIEINFSDKELFYKFADLGFPIGKKGTKLIIPKILLDHMNPIVQGYFATDGSLVITNNNGTKYPRIEFSSISEPLLRQVKNYLDSLGITGNIYLSKKYKNNWNNLYRLQINGKKKLFLFEKKIGFINDKHKEKLKQFSDNFIN